MAVCSSSYNTARGLYDAAFLHSKKVQNWDESAMPTELRVRKYAVLVVVLLLLVGFGILAISEFFQHKSVIPAAVQAGEPLYTTYCASCHKSHGRGIPGEVPPLANADYLYTHPVEHLIRFLLFGYKGRIVVNNEEYRSFHQPFAQFLTDQQLAQVMSYVYNAWTNLGPIVSADTVAFYRRQGRPVTTAEVLEPQKGLDIEQIPRDLLLKHGQKVYRWYCRNCHGLDGKGRPGVYPPLKNSDYLAQQPIDTIIHNVVFGLQRPIRVNGVVYQGRRMPPLSPKVSDIDLAAVLAYIFAKMTPREFTLDLRKIRQIRQQQFEPLSYRKADERPSNGQ